MIRFASVTIAVAALVGSLALAQDSTPKVQVFGGFSLVHLLSGGLNGNPLDLALREQANTFEPTTNFKGWSAEAQYNFDRWLGLAVDFGGRSGSPITASSISKISGLPDATSYSYLVGPVISYRTKSKLTPFVHALFGFDRTNLKASTITGLASPAPAAATNYTDFAFALGAGVDYKIVRHFALRGGLDYFITSINQDKFYQSVFGPTLFLGPSTRQRNVRFSGGFVVSF